ncbi:MAG: PKD domain-containing protein [Bacteroidota bacterium]|nr:PKD domain-containing protein [Bacteroidota bacterium]
MKNIFPLLLFAIVLASCTKEETNNPDNNNNDTTTLAPIPDFSYTLLGNYPPVEVTFTNKSLLASSFNWEFGDGTTSTEKNPTHLYSYAGSFFVKLTAYNNDTSKSKSKTVIIPEIPTKLFLKELLLDTLPFTDFYNLPWDSNSGPDVFFRIETPAYVMIYKSDNINNIEETDLPVSWTYNDTPIEIADIGDNFQFVFSEDDGGSYMAIETPTVFNFSNFSDYPETVQLISPNGKLEFTLKLEWQ